ncbi:MAG: TIR domain-containing protein, partial [Myxococcales bacterium]|nr:TIR domain-containing protein [Myxococcales bacterium]
MPVRVFISYSHDSDAHRDRVLAFADRLRAEGIEAQLDQYVAHPPEGWPSWAQQQIVEADFTILVCTATYNLRFEGKEAAGIGHGATWEAWILKQRLYEAGSRNYKIIPVRFPDGNAEDTPLVLRPFTSYALPGDYDDLYRHLTGQPRSPAPPVGSPRVLPPTPRRAEPEEGLERPSPREERSPWPGTAVTVIGLAAVAGVAWAWSSTPRPGYATPAHALDDQEPDHTASIVPTPTSTAAVVEPATTTSAHEIPPEPDPEYQSSPTPAKRSGRADVPSPPPPPPDSPTLSTDPRRWKALEPIEDPERFVGT